MKPTDDQAKFTRADPGATVMAIWNGTDSWPLAGAMPLEDEELAVILDRTNFYAEMGGQVGDAGELRRASGAIFDVETTRAVGGYVLHIGNAPQRHAARAASIVDRHGRRACDAPTEQNHTTTHLANWALREVLGDEVQQKGSLVDPEKLRFDFSHGKSLSEENWRSVETLVNEGDREEAAGLCRGGAAGAGVEDPWSAGGVRREVSADGAGGVDRRAGGGTAGQSGESEVAAVFASSSAAARI